MITTGDAAGRRLALATTSVLVLLLFGLRAVLAYVREPFFDELFTTWISARPLAGILEALRLDSGPPLYYFLTHGVAAFAGSSVTGARAVSLLFALLAFVAVMSAKWLGEARWAAAILLGVIPAHFYFSAEGRAYAMCGLLVGLGTLAIARWGEEGGERRLWLGSAVLVAAAYTHYYGVLLFPLPFVTAVLTDRRRAVLLRGAAASVLCAIAFIPGFRLAAAQPVVAATRWMSPDPYDLALSLPRLTFAGPYPPAFAVPPPLWMQIAVGVLVILVLVSGLWRAPRARSFAVATMLPIVLAAVATIGGWSVYFPFRFEAVLAIPFAIWLAASMQPLPRAFRSPALVAFLVAGFSVCLGVTMQQSRSSDDPYRAAALAARARIDSREAVVATGYAYLEVVSQFDSRWRPQIRSFPSDQALHPGWRSAPAPEELSREAATLPQTFIWIGAQGSREQTAIRGVRRETPLLRVGPVVITRMTPFQ